MGTNVATARGQPAVLNSWKEISAYLVRGVRTAQRWHSVLQLPVHKVRGTPRSPVFAYKSELDLWMRRWVQREKEEESPSSEHKHPPVSSAAKRAMSSASKMFLLLNKQHNQLNRLVEQVNRLAQLQKNDQRKVG